jgi:hypothetical protein
VDQHLAASGLQLLSQVDYLFYVIFCGSFIANDIGDQQP